MNVKSDHRSKFSNLSSWKLKEKPEKNQGFNGIRTLDLRDTGAMLYQLSYEATNWERGQFIGFVLSHVYNVTPVSFSFPLLHYLFFVFFFNYGTSPQLT